MFQQRTSASVNARPAVAGGIDTGIADAPIRLEGIGKRYGQNAVPALETIDLSINKGEVCGIIGRSGAGKSTLIRLINRLEQPTAGRVLVGGTDIGTLDEKDLVRLRRRIGMIFQHFNLLSAKTVWDNVALPLRVAGIPSARIRERTAELLDLVGLEERKNAYPAQLSGGQKQRVGIARALVHNPEILLCDEATSALDPETTESILKLIQGINRKLGLTIVLITHEMSVIRAVSDRVVVLEAGKIVEQGTTGDIFISPRHEVTRALLAPLTQKLPEEFTRTLTSVPSGERFQIALELAFKDGAAPDLGEISAVFASPIKLIHANIDQIENRYHGRLVLVVESTGAAAETMLKRIDSLPANINVLGYSEAT